MAQAMPVTVEEMMHWVMNPVLMLAAQERDLLRRCAWTHTFNRELYDAVLAPGAVEPLLPFDELAKHRFVEALPAKCYRVVSSFRAGLLNTPREQEGEALPLGAVPDDLQELSARLAEYYRDREDVYEQLRHLAVVDPKAAGDLFKDLYGKADRRFDLPRCHAIVQVLEERGATLPLAAAELDPTLKDAAGDMRRSLEARWLWAQEYYWTVTYVERETTRYVLRRLLAGKQGWLIHIHARGGTGKTMFLRAVIARRCVPKGIACAAIDFDDHHHLEGVSEPWRLAYAIAEQLNVQLPGGPFDTFLRENAPYMQEAAGTGDGIGSRPTLSKEQQDVRVRQVADSLGNRRVMVLFDTMENLRELGSDLGPLTDLVRTLHNRCDLLRVIFSGRYPIVKDPQPSPAAASLAGLIDAEGSELFLPGFSEDEARSYLRRRRRITDEAIETAILSKSFSDPKDPGLGYNPFKLAVLADEVKQHPKELTAEKIKEYPEADVVYLIERVVARIVDPQLQWLLRYGVIPRWLTYDFFIEVLAKRIVPKLQGDRTGDDKSADKIPKRAQAKSFLEQGPNATLETEEVWRKLESYVSPSSWVFRARGPAEGALEFHPDVREPMRRILRDRPEDQPVYLELNGAAAVYFTGKARPASGQAPAPVSAALRREWLRQAVYHWFETLGAGAVSQWRDLLSGAGDDPAAQVAVAREGLEAVKALAQPPAEVQVRAGYTLARAYLLHEGLEGGVDASRIDAWLAMSEGLNPPDAPLAPPDELALLRARLDLRRGNPTGALAACDRALSGPVSAATEIELRLLRADSLQALERSEAADAYRTALDLAARSIPRRRMAIWSRLGESLVDWERFAEATVVWNDLRAAAMAEQDAWTAGTAAAELIRTQVAMGLEEQAATLGLAAAGELEQRPGASIQGELALARIRAEVALARGQPEAAQAEVERAQALAREAHLEEWDAILRALEARAAAGLCDAETALRQLSWLIDKVFIPGAPRTLRAQLECARISIDVAGNLREAERWLAATETQGQGKAWEVRRRLLDIRRLAASGAATRAAAAASELATSSDLPSLPGLRAQVLLEDLIQNGFTEARLERTVAALKAVEPPEHRLAIAAELKRAAGAAPSRNKVVKRLLQLLPAPDGVDPQQVWVALRLADVLRWARAVKATRKMLDGAEAGCKQPLRLALLREVYLARDRADWPGQGPRRIVLPDRSDPAWERAAGLSAVILLEHAGRVWQAVRKANTVWVNSQEVAGLKTQLAEAEKLTAIGLPPLYRVSAGRLLAAMAWSQSKQLEARRALDQYGVLDTLGQLGRESELATALGDLAASHEERGSWPSAIAERRREAELYRGLGREDEWRAAATALAGALLNYDKTQEALDLLREQLLPACRAREDAGGETRALGLVAIALAQLGRLADARQARQEQLAQVQRGGDALLAAESGLRLAQIFRGQGDTGEALRILQDEVEPVYRERRYDQYSVLIEMASLLEQTGDEEGARKIRTRIEALYWSPYGAMGFELEDELRWIESLSTPRERADALVVLLQKLRGAWYGYDRLYGPPDAGFLLMQVDSWVVRLRGQTKLDSLDAGAELSIRRLEAAFEAARYAAWGDEAAAAAADARVAELEAQIGASAQPEPGTVTPSAGYRKEILPEPPVEGLQISVREEPNAGWRITAYSGDAAEPAAENSLTGPLREIVGVRRDAAVSYDFVRQFTDAWWEVGGQLADAFLASSLQAALTQRTSPLDMAWDMPGCRLNYLPLEFLRLREDRLPFALSETCRCFYRRVHGRPWAVAGGPGLDVIILRQASFSRVEQVRSLGRIASSHIWTRAAPGANVFELDSHAGEKLGDLLASGRPSVLQVQAGFMEVEGRAVLEWAPDSASPSEERVSQPPAIDAREFAYILRSSMRKSQSAPLLVLDPPAPGTLPEKVRQLCLRNAFAADLAEREAAAAIICTGLGHDAAQQQLTETLAEGWVSGRPIGEIVQRMRRRALASAALETNTPPDSETYLQNLLPFAGTALFAADPWQGLSLQKEG